jgi:hypothetical protein
VRVECMTEAEMSRTSSRPQTRPRRPAPSRPSLQEYTERPPRTKRGVNDLMRESLRLRGTDGRTSFFCECGDPCCYRAVSLTCEQYDHRRSNPRWLALSPGHALAPAGEAAATG